MNKTRITIQCNQTDCIHNSEYTINNEHECSLVNPDLKRGLKNKRVCNSYEKESVITTQDLLEIDEEMDKPKHPTSYRDFTMTEKITDDMIPPQCIMCITTDTDYCLNVCPIKSK